MAITVPQPSKPTFLVNARYIFPLFINGKQCLGLRDSGCFSNLLVAKHLISAQDYIPNRYVKMQGLLYNGRLPVTQMSVQSPKFCSDWAVKTTALICDYLPCNIDSIVGNIFFSNSNSQCTRCHKFAVTVTVSE